MQDANDEGDAGECIGQGWNGGNGSSQQRPPCAHLPPAGPSQGAEDSLLGTQSRAHFSRQPIKYTRGGMRPITHQLSSLALVASKLCEEDPVLPTPQEGSLHRRGELDGNPRRRSPLPKNLKITQETARLLAKLPEEAVPKAACCPDTQAAEEVDDHL